jgi:uncharacterized protein (DUF1697 family)
VNYLALIRGINVGGKNIVTMPELRVCLESMGLKNVTTYIQSGNVLFESRLKNTAELSRRIEQALSEELLKAAQAVVVSQQELENVVTKAPSAFGADPSRYRYDVAFIKAPLRARELVLTIDLKEGVDEVFEGNGVLYFTRLTSKASQSRLPRLTATPAYKSMTLRNWTTVTKLYELIRIAKRTEAVRALSLAP